jgi:HTH-type transcriptional regulator, competence development regulator
VSQNFAETLQDARTLKGLSLRAAAVVLAITPSYLSDIENDRRIPSEEVMQRIATLYGLDFDNLMCLAGRLGEVTEKYIKRQPEAIRLMRRCAEAKLTAAELGDLIRKIGDL